MSVPSISVENISKAYRIGIRHQSADTLVGAVKNMLSSPFRNARNLRRLGTVASAASEAPGDDTLWALKDVSFEVKQGDVVGVIGRNGAGKSTLLKILSRVTEPTSGRVVIHGRISSLLEVGTGFHPELTGRDNIYMNGTILGMTKREIDGKFDEIVDFSGVEKFLDTPTKRYSSGMQVRLAFAVAAHLEPEILIVDEVLAVGDAEFQKKCMGKMQQVAGSGRTVIFVSHNLSSVRQLCQNGIVLQSGLVQSDGTIDDAITCYTASLHKLATTDVAKRTDRGGNGQAILTHASVASTDLSPISTGSAVTFNFEFQSEIPQVECVFTIYGSQGESLLSFGSAPAVASDRITEANGKRFECQIDECPLMPGDYRINVALQCGADLLDHISGATTFSVASGYMRGRSVSPFIATARLATPHQWTRGKAA